MFRKLFFALCICVFSIGTTAAQGLDAFFGLLMQGMQEQNDHSNRSTATYRRKIDVRWLVVASRTNSSEAINLAQSYAQTLGPILVAQSRNGSYAVVAGLLLEQKAKENLEALKAIRLVPDDSFLSAGQNLVRSVWASSDNVLEVEVVKRDELKRSAARIQAALQQMGFYESDVDGLIGPSTSKAFAAFAAGNHVAVDDAFNLDTITQLEAQARDGFSTDADRLEARRQGFSDKATFAESKAGGFIDHSEFARGRALGFQNRSDLLAFSGSGFRNKAEFQIARQSGFTDKVSYDAYQSEQLKKQRETADLLIGDTDVFLRVNNSVPNVEKLAQAVAILRDASRQQDVERLGTAIARLVDILDTVPGFGDFRRLRDSERQEVRNKEIATNAERLTKMRDRLRRWMALNLTHSASNTIAVALDGVDQVLQARVHDELARKVDQLVTLVGKYGLDAEIERSVGETTGRADKSFAITRTEANAFLLEGSADEIVALYNAASSDAAVVKNLLGAFEFESQRPAVCALPYVNLPKLKRALDQAFADAGASSPRWSRSECNSEAAQRMDVLILKRGAFLKSGPVIALPLLEAVEGGQLRAFPVIADKDITARMAAEDRLAADIGADIDRDGRNGFGALATSLTGGEFCTVIQGTDEVHAPWLDRLRRYLESEGSVHASVLNVDANGAFKGLQRGQCSVVYAGQPDLKLIARALKGDNRAFEYLPVWAPQSDLDEATARLQTGRREATEAAERRRQDAEEQRRLAEQTRATQAQTAEARQQQLRTQFGAEARALETVLASGLKKLVLDEASADPAFPQAVRAQFGEFDNWRRQLAANYWEPAEFKSEIVEYGIAKWKERGLEALAMQADIQVVSRQRGERHNACFIFVLIFDQEFQMWRDGFSSTCETGAPRLQRWSTGHELTSRWNP